MLSTNVPGRIQITDLPGIGQELTILPPVGEGVLKQDQPLQPSWNLVPALTVNAPADGMYRVSASVTLQNTDPSLASEIGVGLFLNGAAMPDEQRVLSFAPNSHTSQQSLYLEDDVMLTKGELMQIQANPFTGDG